MCIRLYLCLSCDDVRYEIPLLGTRKETESCRRERSRSAALDRSDTLASFLSTCASFSRRGWLFTRNSEDIGYDFANTPRGLFPPRLCVAKSSSHCYLPMWAVKVILPYFHCEGPYVIANKWGFPYRLRKRLRRTDGLF